MHFKPFNSKSSLLFKLLLMQFCSEKLIHVLFQDARASFRQALTDSTHQLNSLAKKLGSVVEKARPYYDARMKAKEVKRERRTTKKCWGIDRSIHRTIHFIYCEITDIHGGSIFVDLVDILIHTN